MSLYFQLPCRMSLSPMSHVEFKKCPCRSVEFKKCPCHSVEFKGQEPKLEWHLNPGLRSGFRGLNTLWEEIPTPSTNRGKYSSLWGPVINYGEGGGAKNGGGGGLPQQQQNGVGRGFSHSEGGGGGTTCFKIVLTRELEVLSVLKGAQKMWGAKKFYPVLRGWLKKFGPAILPFCSAPDPHN